MVFYSSFVEKDRHGIFNSDVIDVFEGIFNDGHRDFEFVFESFH